MRIILYQRVDFFDRDICDSLITAERLQEHTPCMFFQAFQEAYRSISEQQVILL